MNKIIVLVIALVVLLVGMRLVVKKSMPQKRVELPMTASNTASLSVSLTSDSLAVRPGEEFEIKVKILPSNVKIGAASLVLAYDPEMLEPIKQELGSYWSEGMVVLSDINRSEGMINFVIGESINSEFNPELPLAVLRFKVGENVSDRVSFSLNDESEFTTAGLKSSRIDFESTDFKIPIDLE